ncbi:MAG TPA: hypothetical protein VF526_22215 [Solirubrobacteraceae bacterium]
MHEIYDAGVAKGLFGGLTGKTPVNTLTAQLAIANKRRRWVNSYGAPSTAGPAAIAARIR